MLIVDTAFLYITYLVSTVQQSS